MNKNSSVQSSVNQKLTTTTNSIRIRSRFLFPLIGLLIISFTILSIIFVKFLNTGEKEKITQNITTVYRFTINTINQKIHKLNKINNSIINDVFAKQTFTKKEIVSILEANNKPETNLIILDEQTANPELVLNKAFLDTLSLITFDYCFSQNRIDTLHSSSNGLLLIQGTLFEKKSRRKCSLLIEKLDHKFFSSINSISKVTSLLFQNGAPLYFDKDSLTEKGLAALAAQSQTIDTSQISFFTIKPDKKQYVGYFPIETLYNQNLALGIISKPLSIKFLIQRVATIGILLLMSLGVLGALFFVSMRTITKPIHKMVYTMRLIAKGKFNVGSNIKKGPQEIIYLSYRLDQMIIKLKGVRSKEKALNKAQTEFLSIAAHQLRTPLTAVRWAFSGAIQSEATKQDQSVQGLLKEGQQNIRRALDLIDDLLHVLSLKLKKIKMESKPLNWLEILKQMAQDTALKNLMKARQIKLETNWNEQSLKKCCVKADKKQITMVINNLIENAVKYSPPQAKIILSAKKDSAKNEVITSVQDFGIGIPKEEQKRIFEQFFRGQNALKIETEGNGLGLHLCSKIIKNHAGKIWFKSENSYVPKPDRSRVEPAKKGVQPLTSTTFYISLPLTPCPITTTDQTKTASNQKTFDAETDTSGGSGGIQPTAGQGHKPTESTPEAQSDKPKIEGSLI